MVLIRRSQGHWHEPETSAYANEKELQDLVKRSPTLLPGSNALAVVDEFWVPGVGSTDLVAVSAAGEITIVECKLNANPEIRREVVGQTLAYAGGLWRMSYGDFDANFTARAGADLHTSVLTATKEDVDESELRDSVSRRLADGEFRLIIAVDSITPELRLIIEYLNEHTTASVQILGLELAYGKDSDVELLIPTVYGEESADRKAQSSTSKWTAATFAEQVQARTDGPVRDFIEKLVAHGTQKGDHPFYGSGATPGMSYYYGVNGRPLSVWALYLYQPVARVAVSLGAVASISPEKATNLLHHLKSDPTLAAALSGLDGTTLNKYPQIPIEPVLTDAHAEQTFFAALDALVEHD